MKEIPLTQGKVALVDDEDFERLSRHKWHAAKDNHTWYAQGHFFIEPGVVRSLRTYRELLGLKEGDGREGDPIRQASGEHATASQVRPQYGREQACLVRSIAGALA